jgi:hypothetical protein
MNKIYCDKRARRGGRREEYDGDESHGTCATVFCNNNVVLYTNTTTKMTTMG